MQLQVTGGGFAPSLVARSTQSSPTAPLASPLLVIFVAVFVAQRELALLLAFPQPVSLTHQGSREQAPLSEEWR